MKLDNVGEVEKEKTKSFPSENKKALTSIDDFYQM